MGELSGSKDIFLEFKEPSKGRERKKGTKQERAKEWEFIPYP